jgi:hypothetical protein
MSWLRTAVPPRTLGDALALRPDLLAGYRRLEAALAAEPTLDATVRRRCRARIATLVGVGGEPVAAPAGDDVVLEFVEQFVLDPHGVSDALVARLGAVLAPGGIVALAQAVAVWEGECRLARCLEVSPEL